MQVSCSQCGAHYEFDAQAIPAAGYDAQCSTCQAIFFVKPEAVASAAETTITVSCTRCAAQYQFAPSGIPAEGYDAQCTTCQNIFFVSRNPQAAAPGLQSGQSAYQPAQAAAQAVHQPAQAASQPAYEPVQAASQPAYQPAQAASQPAYEPVQAASQPAYQPAQPASQPAYQPAQPASQPAYQPAQPAAESSAASPVFSQFHPVTPTPRADAVLASPFEPLAPMPILGAPTPQAVAAAFAPKQPAPGDVPEVYAAEFNSVSEVMRMPLAQREAAGDDVGAGAAAQSPEAADATTAQHPRPAAPNDDDDFSMKTPADPTPLPELPQQADAASPTPSVQLDMRVIQRSSVLTRLLGVAALIGVLLVGGVWALWTHRYDTALQKLLGTHHTLTPEVQSLLAQGTQALLDDTDESYQTAAKHLQAALSRDPQCADAYAYLALSHALRGADLQAQGHALSAALQAKQNALHAQSAHGTAAAKHAEAQHHEHAAQQQQHIRQLLETGNSEIALVGTVQEQGVRALGANGTLATGHALCLAVSVGNCAANAGPARAALQKVLPEQKLQPPLSRAWLQFAKGMLQAADSTDVAQLTQTLQQALTQEPRLLRARWFLAQALAQRSRPQEAVRLLNEVLSASPGHPKALAALQQLSGADHLRPSSLPAAPSEASERPVKHRRGRSSGRHR
jgi:hypothetical protein